MKRFVHDVHLSDVLGHIIFIEFCDDVFRNPCKISASEDIDDDFASMLEMDDIRYTMTDKQLIEMSDESVASVTKPELLHRLYRLCKDRLNESQIQILRKYYSESVIVIDNSDIIDFLEKLKDCTRIDYRFGHSKTNEFVLDSNRKFRESDCLKLLKSLTLSDHRNEDMYSADDRYFSDRLIVFRPHIPWTLNDGTVLMDYCVYVKLDLDTITGDCVVLVSMHDAKYED